MKISKLREEYASQDKGIFILIRHNKKLIEEGSISTYLFTIRDFYIYILFI